MNSIEKKHRFKFSWKDKDSVFLFIVYTLVVLITIIIAYPLYFVIIASISDPDLVTSGQVLLIPKGINFEGYKYIFDDNRIWTGYYNTIRYAFFGTLIALLITLPAGYALSRKDLKGRTLILKLVMFTKFFNGGLIPTYLVVQALHLVDTPYVLMILGSFNIFNLILCRTFFANTIPLELQEAAAIDGCGISRFFFTIVLPLSKSIIAIMVLYYAVGHWNAFFNSLIYITNNKLYPLQMVVREILIIGQDVQAGSLDPESFQELQLIARTIKYGVIIISSAPVLLMYPFVQKYFVKGVMVGSLKG